MATISKSVQSELVKELDARFGVLYQILGGRDLASAKEGLVKGYWKSPESRLYIDTLKLALALSDFKSILALLAKIK